MLLGRGTRRVIGAVLLASMLASSVYALVGTAAGLRLLYDTRWFLIALVAILIASNVYRFWNRRRVAAAAAPKPRPTHLKLVRNDETLH